MPATILVVEDHDAVRKSLQDWLEVEFPDCQILAVACGEEAISQTRIALPSLVVMVISISGTYNNAAMQQMKALLPSAQFVMLAIHAEDAHGVGAVISNNCGNGPRRVMLRELVPTLVALLNKGERC